MASKTLSMLHSLSLPTRFSFLSGLFRWSDLPPALIFFASQYYYKYELKAAFINAYWILWQMIDLKTLHEDLWGSLLYQHAQPPLLNLLLGIFLYIDPMRVALLHEWLYILLGLIAVIVMNRTFLLLGIRTLLSWVVIFWLCFFPTFYLFANWGYTTHIEFSMCALLLYGLAKLRHQELTFKRGVLVFLPFGILCLLRPHWHPIMLLGLLSIIYFHRRHSPGMKSFALGACLTLYPIFLVFIKNYLVFGIFASSSMLGMNLSTVVERMVPSEVIAELKAKGEIAPYYPIVFYPSRAHRAVSQWEREGRPLPPNYQHPALELENGRYNYQPFIVGGKQDLKDSLTIIKHYPEAYIRTVISYIMHSPTIPTLSFVSADFRLENLPPFNMQYERLPSSIQRMAIEGSVLYYAIIPFLVLALAAMPGGYIARQREMVLYGAYMALILLCVACAFNGLEIERMRWATEPVYLLYFVLLAEAVMRGIEWATARFISRPLRYFCQETT